MSLPGSAGGFGAGGTGGGAAGGSGAAPEAKLKAGERKRTEFVIFFYWQEPLPSEPPDAGGDKDASMDSAQGYPGGGPGAGYPGAGGPGANYPGRN